MYKRNEQIPKLQKTKTKKSGKRYQYFFDLKLKIIVTGFKLQINESNCTCIFYHLNEWPSVELFSTIVICK